MIDVQSSATKPRPHYAPAASHNSTGAIHLNLTDLHFCDSTGLNILVALLQRAHSEHGTFALADTPERFRKLLRITGLSMAVTEHPHFERALAAIPAQDTRESRG
ncbi:STAS domain-containing protein [Embleya sp. NPDC050493]|uniref:STAS domain-containing protein n=1 Tax=Embleya sp. NPDC050493 TaxID=3363989 RepID=UPI0037B7E76C